jgi:hypothetical protein
MVYGILPPQVEKTEYGQEYRMIPSHSVIVTTISGDSSPVDCRCRSRGRASDRSDPNREWRTGRDAEMQEIHVVESKNASERGGVEFAWIERPGNQLLVSSTTNSETLFGIEVSLRLVYLRMGMLR